MLALENQVPHALERRESLSNTDLDGAAMIAARLRVDLDLLLDRNNLGTMWRDIAKEFMEFTKRCPSDEKIIEAGRYRFSHRRSLALYTLEDTGSGICRVLRYGENREPELMLEYDIDTEGKRTWKVVYSIGGKYPLPGATMQRRADS